MGQHSKSTRAALAELRQVSTASAGFLLSIELWLMVLAASASVGGVWLAFMGDLRCLPAFCFAFGYPALRVLLHLRRLLAWPFF